MWLIECRGAVARLPETQAGLQAVREGNLIWTIEAETKQRLRLLLATKGARARDRARVAPDNVGNVTMGCQETITSTTA